MFADVAGFTAISEKQDPEKISAFMNECFAVMEKTIEQYGGSIDKFMGDCVMALFGVPVATEQSVSNAVDAALALRRRIRRFSAAKMLPDPMDVHIGINTGVVLAGKIGGRRRRDYTVMGDAVNIAARLEDMSRNGQILVGPATWNATKTRFHYNKLSSTTLKGKSEPIAVYELLEKKADKKKTGCGPPPAGNNSVGRESQVRRITSILKKAANGYGRIVAITGEAGIGKTSLLARIKRQDIVHRFTFMEGAALTFGESLQYHPFADMIVNWSGILDQDDVAVKIKKINAGLEAIAGGESDDMLPFVAAVAGAEPEQPQMNQSRSIEGDARELLLVKHMKKMFVHLACRRPLAVVMEDLHWADHSSLRLLEALFSLPERFPITFIILFRLPHDGSTFQNWFARVRKGFRSSLTEINLAPLNKHYSRLLLDGLYPTACISDPVKSKIVRRTGGNPFFIKEVVGALVNDTVGRSRDSADAPSVTRNDLPLPMTVIDVLMARIDRLDRPARQVLRTASVIGRRFLRDVLAEVTGERSDIQACLRSLERADFIQKQSDSRGGEYCFKHALVQEAAYDSMLIQQRQALHHRIAVAIERLYPQRLNEFFGLLAYHYSCADDRENAEAYMVRSGEEALKIGASGEARHYYQKALSLYLKKPRPAADPLRLAMLEENVALSFYNQGSFKESLHYCSSALARYGFRNNGPRPMDLWRRLIEVFLFFVSLYAPGPFWNRTPSKKDGKVALLLYRKLACLSNLDPRRFLVEAISFARFLSRFDLSKLENGVGMYAGMSVAFSWSATSYAISRKVMALASSKQWRMNPRSRLYLEVSRLFVDYYTGNWQEPYDTAVVEEGMKIGEVMHAAIYVLFHGRIQLELGHYQQAKSLVRKLTDIGFNFSHDFTRGLKYYLNTKLLLKYRKIDAARLEVEEGIHFVTRTDYKPLLFVLLAFKARIQLCNREFDGAGKSLNAADELDRRCSITAPYRCNYLISKLQLYVMKWRQVDASPNRKPTKALQASARLAATELLKLTRRLVNERVEVYRLVGISYCLTGKWRKAEKWWLRSLAEGEKLGARLELARTYMTVGGYLGDTSRRSRLLAERNADDYLQKGRALIEELNLYWEEAARWEVDRFG